MWFRAVPALLATYRENWSLRSAKIHAPDTIMFTPSLSAPRYRPIFNALLLASLAAGAALPFIDKALPPFAMVTVKGLGVGLLAVAAALLASPRRWWLAAIMGAGALGDVLLEIPGLFLAGAAAFAIGHVIASIFYLRDPDRNAGTGRRIAAAALILWGLAMPVLVSPPGTPVGALALYSVLLCGMAAALLLSAFPRLALVGALLFVVSDTLLIMRLGGRLIGDSFVHGLLVWFTYYFGQAMIFFGVARGLSKQ